MTVYGTTGGPFPGTYDQRLPADASAPWHETVSAAAAAAATAVDHNTAITAPNVVAGKVTEVTFTPAADITGADTNTRTVSLVSGSVTIATYTFSAGNDATSGDPVTIPITGKAHVEAGASLSWHSTHVGTGLADPGGTVTVHVSGS